MSEKLTVIYTAANPQQAHLLKNRLEREGVEARLFNETLQSAQGEVPFGWASSPRVVVAEKDAKRARELAEAFEREGNPQYARPDPATIDVETSWRDWPLCPECGHRRQAVCPTCGHAGDDLPLAEYLTAGEPLRESRRTADDAESEESPPSESLEVLLMCPECDEAFPPRFYRSCQWCGHDFGFGVRVEDSAADENDEVSERAVWLAGALALVGAGVLVYFWFLLQR